MEYEQEKQTDETAIHQTQDPARVRPTIEEITSELLQLRHDQVRLLCCCVPTTVQNMEQPLQRLC